MNPKVLAGFLGGVLIASGAAYLLSHRGSPATPATVAAAPASLAPAEPPPAPAPERVPIKKKIASRAAVIERPAVPTTPKPAAAPAPAPVPTPALAPETPHPQEIAIAVPPPPPAPAPPPAPEPPHSVTLGAGTLISVRLGEALSSHRNQSGDTFSATLDQPLVADGFAIAERGARVEGRIAEAEQAGRVKGLAHLALELTELHTSDGQRITIRTARFEKTGPESKRQDAEKIGVGAVLGTIIGAAAGGGKGAAIGAAAGGAAGTGTVMATRGKPAELPVETRISFRLDQPVTITEQPRR